VAFSPCPLPERRPRAVLPSRSFTRPYMSTSTGGYDATQQNEWCWTTPGVSLSSFRRPRRCLVGAAVTVRSEAKKKTRPWQSAALPTPLYGVDTPSHGLLRRVMGAAARIRDGIPSDENGAALLLGALPVVAPRIEMREWTRATSRVGESFRIGNDRELTLGAVRWRRIVASPHEGAWLCCVARRLTCRRFTMQLHKSKKMSIATGTRWPRRCASFSLGLVWTSILQRARSTTGSALPNAPSSRLLKCTEPRMLRTAVDRSMYTLPSCVTERSVVRGPKTEYPPGRRRSPREAKSRDRKIQRPVT